MRRVAAAVVVASLVVTVVSVGVVLTHGDADGRLFDHPLVGLWTLQAGTVLGMDGGVVVVREGAVVAGYAQDDGEELWHLELGAEAGVDSCASAVTTDPGTLWCWRTAQPMATADGRTEQRASALVGVDLRDGAVTTERPMSVPWVGVVAVGPDLVLGDRVRGDLTLTRVDVGTWRPVWVAAVALAPVPSTEQYEATIEVVEGAIVVHGPTVAVVDAADGRVLRTWDAPDDDTLTVGADGAQVEVTPFGFAASGAPSDGVGAGQSAWYDTSGRRVVEYEGMLAEPAASDGSEPGIILVSRRGGTQVAGVDAATGTARWTLPTEDGVVLARHDGTVVIATGQSVTCLELLTGWERWSAEVAGLRTDAGAVSDGDVAVVMAVQGREWVFVAYDVASGDRAWFARAAGTPDLDDLFYIGGAPRLTMLGDSAVVESAQGITWLG